LAQHCPECGFQNVEGANYCQRCGAFLGPPGDAPPEPSTASYTVGETGDVEAVELDELVAQGPTLVIRAGGGRAGETFLLDRDRLTVGRRPESDIFLDDVTVSRRHAEFSREGEGFQVRDVGSLNGTYLNRERIDAAPLANGDEVQIGKFRLVYLTAGEAAR
jgi:hypothetical protein